MTTPPQYPSYSGGNYPGGNYQGGPQGPGPKPSAPGTVTAAFALYVLAALVSLVGVFLVFTDAGTRQIRDALRDTNTGNMSLDDLVRVTRTITVAVVVVFLALYLFFAFMMRAGRNWARIVLTVLSALSIASSFAGSVAATRSWATWVTLVFSILAIVLMYLAQSNQYFADSKAYRKGAVYR
ncbi:hypothetical protein GIS00_11145 [Nakamurella sp. YIM 132087]|uniref:Uncharacterized protein n=1 Tax=Nakamurella alba TaxID=2665158 RepID=A0A7K1FK41_9ACTN|nr:hypothetical protein [Nakamurella alba]MTD14502.1 hypothetical protein [Nakamurella alba]